MNKPIIQAKLTVGVPNDKYEKEADRVADQVTRMPDPQVTGSPSIQCVCTECATEAERAGFETHFGVDFSQVRIHDDVRTGKAAMLISALACMHGSDIVLRAGQYTANHPGPAFTCP